MGIVYWADRAKNAEAETNMSNVNRMMQVSNLYDKAISDIEKDIRKMVETYARNGGIDEKKALEYLTHSETNTLLKELQDKISAITDKKIRKQAEKLLNLKAYRYRISRLQALEKSIEAEFSKLAGLQTNIVRNQAIDDYKDAYYKTVFSAQVETGYGFSFAKVPIQTLNKVLNYKWSRKHFSDTIWDNTHVLAKQVKEIVKKGITTGKSYTRLSQELRDKMDSGKYQAARVIRTEMNYFHTMGTLEGLKETGCKKYVFVAQLEGPDNAPCNHCQDLDLEVFDIEEALSGKNLPPMHPNCRCTIAGVYNEDILKRLERRARDPVTGRTYLVPGGINYKQWRKSIEEREETE